MTDDAIASSATAIRSEKTSTPQKNDGRRHFWGATDVVSVAKFALSHCTVEPMLGFYIVSSVLASLATQNLNLQKACRVNLRMDNATCSALEAVGAAGNYTKEDEMMVQGLVADMIMWKMVVQSSIPSVLIVFVGSWSDRNHKRKPCMLIPFVGEFLTSVGLLVCTYYFYELPMGVAGIVESLPPAMTGGWMTMFMAVFSYIGDVTTVKMRTLRIGIVNVFCSVGVPIGSALSGVLYKKLGFYGVYTIATVLYVLGFLYGVVFIKEPEPKTSVQNQEPPKDQMSFLDFIKDFFNPSHIKETVQVTFKKRQHNRRLRIILLMVVVIVITGPLHGEMSVVYMFTRVRFNWDEVNFSMFNTYSMITNLVGTFLSVSVLSHKLQINDALIGVISCVSNVLAAFVYALATTDFVFYLAPLVDIVNGTSFIAMRSIISKLVPPNELGKVNSLFGVCEALVPLIYGPMYSAVYKATMKTVPGAFFLLGAALTSLAALIFLWLYYENRKENWEKEEALQKEQKKSGTEQKNNNLNFRLSSCHFDLKAILDKRMQANQGSDKFSTFGFDNRSFQMGEGCRRSI